MKKIALILILLFIAASLLTGCSKPIVGYDSYFRNFESVGAYTAAEKVFDLADYSNLPINPDSESFFVSSYDGPTGIYVLTYKRKISGTDYYQYGFADNGGILILPQYASVIDIRGDYAICTKMVALGAFTAQRIGLVKVRGEHKGREFGFSYPYNKNLNQYQFLDDRYLFMLATKTSGSSLSATGFIDATIYDYAEAGGLEILEVGKLKNATGLATFSLHDNLIAYSVNNYFYFYNLKEIDPEGYFKLKYSYALFDTSVYTDATKITGTHYYLGGGWYILNGSYAADTDTGAYDMKDSSTGKYLTYKAVRYNAYGGKAFPTDRIFLVSNKYSDDTIRGLVDSLNAQTNALEGKPVYFPPAAPSSASIFDGYSIVYYYWDYYVQGKRNWSVTFEIYDESGNNVRFSDLPMPLIMVDGIGLENWDPGFDRPLASAVYYTYDKKKIMLRQYESIIKGYETAVSNSGMIVTYKNELLAENSSVNLSSFLGAYDKDGNLAVDFRYSELTPFFGEYATGSKIVDAARTFYRVSNKGIEEQIEEVFALKNGVYITLAGGKYGLRSNAGITLLENEFDLVSVLDTFLVDGKYIETKILTVKNGVGAVYKLIEN